MPAHFYTPAPGTIIYHYTSFAGALAILESDSIWMSDFAKMNDPGEYHYARECYLHAYQNREFYMDMEARLAATFALLGLEENTVMFIACLSPNDDDPHQWRRYGGDGTGCAIGIDARVLHDGAGVTMRRVVYDRATIDSFVAVGLHMLQDQFEEAPHDRKTLIELARFFVSDLFAFKSPEYAAEREIRVSRMLLRDPEAETGCTEVGGHQVDGTELPPLPVKMRNGLAGPTAYISLPLTSAYGPAIRSVTLGPAVEDKTGAIAQLRHAAGAITVKTLA